MKKVNFGASSVPVQEIFVLITYGSSEASDDWHTQRDVNEDSEDPAKMYASSSTR